MGKFIKFKKAMLTNIPFICDVYVNAEDVSSLEGVIVDIGGAQNCTRIFYKNGRYDDVWVPIKEVLESLDIANNVISVDYDESSRVAFNRKVQEVEAQLWLAEKDDIADDFMAKKIAKDSRRERALRIVAGRGDD